MATTAVYMVISKSFLLNTIPNTVLNITVRALWDTRHLSLPKANEGNFRRKVHFPEKYTIEPLRNDHLAGRHPVMNRVVTSKLGGGIKHLYHWIDWIRDGPTEDVPPIKEKVIQIMKCGCRTPNIALVGVGGYMKYIVATANMKAGDILCTSRYIPPNAVFANEGDAYPLGALPTGTQICCIESYPGQGGFFARSAGATAQVLRKVGDRVIIKLPSKLEVSLPEICMATIGQVSNVEHRDTPLGSANALRHTGRRPRSGLWHRKDGKCGRKIRPPPPVLVLDKKEKKKEHIIQFIHPHLAMNYW